MTLGQLISAQKTLQEKTNPVPDIDNLYAAQLAEAGELAQSLKYGVYDDPPNGDDMVFEPWVWWVRKNKKASYRGEVEGEVLDLWLFTLVEYIFLDEEPDEGYYEVAWEGDSPTYENLPSLLTYYFAANSEGLKFKMYWLIQVTKALGINRERMEKLYWEAYEKNVARWKEEGGK